MTISMHRFSPPSVASAFLLLFVSTICIDSNAQDKVATPDDKTKIQEVVPTQSASSRDDLDESLPTESILSDERIQVDLDFLLNGLSHYMATSDASQEHKEQFSKVANAILEYEVTKKGRKSRAEINKMTKALWTGKPKQLDPFENFCQMIWLRKLEPVNAEKHADFALEGFKNRRYPARFAAIAEVEKLQLFPPTVNRTKRKRVSIQGLGTIYYWLTKDFRATPREFEISIEYLELAIGQVSKRNPDSLVEFVELVEENNSIPKYVKLVVLGVLHNRIAWNIRGGGVASTVRQDAWKGFYVNQEKAGDYFKKAHALCDTIPNAPFQMMDIARSGQDENKTRYWFDKTVEARFDFLPAHRSMIFDLYPRWHGSVPEMVDFAKECAATGRYETEVPFLIFDFFNRAWMETPGHLEGKLLRETAVYDEMLECIDGYLSLPYGDRPSDRFTDEFLLSTMAGFAMKFKKFEDASYYFGEIEDNADLDPVGFSIAGIQMSPYYAKGVVEASLGENATDLSLIEQYLDLAYVDAEEVIKKIDPMLANSISKSKNEVEKDFWKNYQSLLQELKDYESGKRVQLKFGQELWRWSSSYFEPFEVNADGTIKIDTRESSSASFELLYRGRFPGSKVIEYEYLSNGPVLERPNLSITDPSRMEVFAPFLCLATQGQFVALFSQDFRLHAFHTNHRQTFIGTRIENKNTELMKVRIYYAPGFLEAYINDELVLRAKNHQDENVEKFVIKNFTNVRGTGKFRNLTVRKWNAGAPPLDDKKKLVEYYAAAVEREPDNLTYWQNYGMAAHHAKQYELSKKIFTQALEKGLGMQVVGFYLGDIADRNGDLEKALEYYSQAYKSPQSSEYDFQIAFGPRVRYMAAPKTWAGYRDVWHYCIGEANFKKTAEEIKVDRYGKGYIYAPIPWSLERIKGMYPLYLRDFDAAIKQLEIAKKLAPEEYRPGIEAQIESYRNRKPYVPDDADKFFYLKIDVPLAIYFYEDYSGTKVPARLRNRRPK